MKLVIEIPNKDIPKHQDIIDVHLHFIKGRVCEAGGYGFIELPKGHGRLIDADELWDSYHDLDYDFYEALDLVDTIIEADTEPMYYPQVDGITPTVVAESEDKE